ncbi:hypothetical protein [Acetonema longum]|uniref:Uncharacterized protein n=1 Tax=Acetonema longum DSM 6540 TaxID=1009370 RepID=F7NJJ0_9FIRM|nr:hypothetical protein [Acetonema longum]EGO63820.1 hypothetical protein ALO_11229 [Acetonema longum DSM 6540]
MTHSLHRSGDIESQKKDFNWFMYQTKGVNDVNIKPKALEFIAAAEAVGSENWGDVKTGPITGYSVEEIKERITDKSRLRGVFTRREQVVEFLKRIKAKDLGQSVVITGILNEVIPACREAGVTPHSVNYSLGVWGKKDNLPDDVTLSITTMCGHHMIPPKFVKHIIKQVEAGRLTPEEGSIKLANFCYCGIFNQVRCSDIIKDNIKK